MRSKIRYLELGTWHDSARLIFDDACQLSLKRLAHQPAGTERYPQYCR